MYVVSTFMIHEIKQYLSVKIKLSMADGIKKCVYNVKYFNVGDTVFVKRENIYTIMSYCLSQSV